MDWLKPANPVVDQVPYVLELTVDAKQHIVLALPVNSVATVALSILIKVLAQLKYGCPAWFGLLYPYSLLDVKEVFAEWGGGDSTKVPSTDPSHWELICSEFSDTFEKPSTPPKRTMKYEIDLLPDFVPSAQSQCRIPPVELTEVRKQLNEYLSKGWIGPSTSPYLAPILLARKKDRSLKICIDYRALNQQIRPNKYPITRIDNLLDCLVNANYLSSIDFHTVYHQFAICPGDEYKTAFLSRHGLVSYVSIWLNKCLSIFETGEQCVL